MILANISFVGAASLLDQAVTSPGADCAAMDSGVREGVKISQTHKANLHMSSLLRSAHWLPEPESGCCAKSATSQVCEAAGRERSRTSLLHLEFSRELAILPASSLRIHPAVRRGLRIRSKSARCHWASSVTSHNSTMQLIRQKISMPSGNCGQKLLWAVVDTLHGSSRDGKMKARTGPHAKAGAMGQLMASSCVTHVKKVQIFFQPTSKIKSLDSDMTPTSRTTRATKGQKVLEGRKNIICRFDKDTNERLVLTCLRPRATLNSRQTAPLAKFANRRQY